MRWDGRRAQQRATRRRCWLGEGGSQQILSVRGSLGHPWAPPLKCKESAAHTAIAVSAKYMVEEEPAQSRLQVYTRSIFCCCRWGRVTSRHAGRLEIKQPQRISSDGKRVWLQENVSERPLGVFVVCFSKGWIIAAYSRGMVKCNKVMVFIAYDSPRRGVRYV